ncbi:MAG: class I SAM-dependent methyltransferase [Saccharofermentans sp.]|nr:class I SAM-dependent methyltransferase [Saccharofermentans sp.]
MNNPWKDISLSDYENHMSLDSVHQLQAMNLIMKDQFEAYPVDTAMVLGIAGGNGLEHVRCDKYKTVYGVDINEDYLKAVSERYSSLNGVLECLQIDLINECDKLPEADLVIANLLIEYIGYEAFAKAMMRVRPQYISCVIQINIDEDQWVSDSPYLHAFDRLDEVHHQMEEQALTDVVEEAGYKKILVQSNPLPNGKALLRIDFERNQNV